MRIVSLLPSATEIVCALGLSDSLVGVTHECDFPEGVSGRPHLTASRISHGTMTSAEIDHAVRSQLDGHGTIYDLDTGLLADLAPDLIITQELCDVCAVSYETVQRAAKMYVADAKVVSLEPATISDIFDNIRFVGGLAGVPERAETAVSALEARLERVRERTRGLPRPRVFMLEWLDPPFSPGHWVPEQVEAAGGEALLGEAGRKSISTTYESVLQSDPEVLVLIPCGYYTSDILRQLPQTELPSDLRSMRAVADGNVWALDATSYFSRPGPRVVDGTEILAKILHPEMFGAPSASEAVRVPAEALRFAE